MDNQSACEKTGMDWYAAVRLGKNVIPLLDQSSAQPVTLKARVHTVAH